MSQTTITAIPSRHWHNHVTGQRASIHGALPFHTPSQESQWETVTDGYTWRKIDHEGRPTVGLGRQSVQTLQEAEYIAARLNAFYENNRRDHATEHGYEYHAD
jgi:hypothetical protein